MAAKSIIVANWKMNPPTFRDAKRLFEASKKAAESAKSVSVVVAPPAIFLRELAASYRGTKLAFALQDGHFDHSGAHTGAISIAQGKDARAHFVIIGHAERREAGETDEDARKKVEAALREKMTPILCVGEMKRTSGGEHFEAVRAQLRGALFSAKAADIKNLIVTYEPLWTIGATTAMDPRQMHEMAIFIRKTIVDLAGDVGHTVRILYGGSIDEHNALAMLQGGDVRGFLVGRASLDAAEFKALLRSIDA